MPVLPVRGRNGSERAGSGPRGHVRTGAGKGRAPYRCIPIHQEDGSGPRQTGTIWHKGASVQECKDAALARAGLGQMGAIGDEWSWHVLAQGPG